MAGSQRVTDLTALGSGAIDNANDLLPIVDVSDTTMAPSGTDKRITLNNILSNSPTLVSPALGTPASGVMTNVSGTAASLTAGTATALATPRTINGVSFDGSANIFSYIFIGTSSGAGTTGANVTPVDVPGLVWTYAVNSTYIFRWLGGITSTVNTTGAGFQLNVSTAVTSINMTFVHQLANTGTQSGGSSNSDDASLGVSSGTPTNATSTPVSGWGVLVTVGNTGTAQLRIRSETTAVTSADAGMVLVVEKVV